MKVYKRGIMSLLISFISYLIGVFVLYLVLSYFVSQLVTSIVTSLAIILVVYLIFFSENISFEIENKTLRYYVNRKLKKEYNLTDIEISYKTVSCSGGTSSIDLYIDDDIIDCTPLGKTAFYTMYDDLEEIVGRKNIKIKVGGKNE